MDKIIIKDKNFIKYISEEKIKQRIKLIAGEISKEYGNKKPLFLGVLNGSFLFFADLIKQFDFECEVSFVKISSYAGTSSKEIKTLIGINENLKNRNVIIVEDIVDTGNTIEKIFYQVKEMNPTEIKIASLFFKSNIYKKDIKIDFKGFDIPDDFIVGYGLDYDGLGRNLKDVYKLI